MANGKHCVLLGPRTEHFSGTERVRTRSKVMPTELDSVWLPPSKSDRTSQNSSEDGVQSRKRISLCVTFGTLRVTEPTYLEKQPKA